MNTRAQQILAKYRYITNCAQLVDEFGERVVDKLHCTVRQVIMTGCFYDVLGTDNVLDVADWLSSCTGVEIDKVVKFLDVCYDYDVSWC